MQRQHAWLGSGLLVLVLCGCGGPRTAPVSGQVIQDGVPVGFGTIGFLSEEDGRATSGMLRPDGTYRVPDAPVGPVIITVQTYPLPPQVQPPDAPAPAVVPPTQPRYVPIAEHYADASTSDLRYKVEPRPQTHNITLRLPDQRSTP